MRRVPKRGVCPLVRLSSHALLLALHRDSLTQLFVALGLEPREAGDDGETGYGIPDRGGQDSEDVIRKVCLPTFSGNAYMRHRRETLHFKHKSTNPRMSEREKCCLSPRGSSEA